MIDAGNAMMAPNASPPSRSQGSQTSIPRGAFTLIELLVIGATVAILLSILLPTVTSVRQEARGLQCASHFKTIATELAFFAKGTAADNRGQNDVLQQNRFWIDDFHEKLYGIDEFWDLPGRSTAELGPGASLMLCPAAKAKLIKRRG